MTKEEKELLLKDLAYRIVYNVKVEIDPLIRSTRYTDNKVRTLATINPQHETIRWIHPNNPEWFGKTYNIKYIKPYLRQMSSMTEEEKKEAEESGLGYFDDGMYQNEDGDRIRYSGKSFQLIPGYETIDWLNEHHFDYRGLISKGLAIEAPEGMYNI